MDTKEKTLELIWEQRKQIITSRTPRVILNVNIGLILLHGYLNGVPAYVGRYYDLLSWIIAIGLLFIIYSLALSGLLFWKKRKKGRIKRMWKQVIRLMLIFFDDLGLLYLTAILLIKGIFYVKVEFGFLYGSVFYSIMSFSLIFISLVALRVSPGKLVKESVPDIEQEIKLRNRAILIVIPVSFILSVLVKGYYASRSNGLEGEINIVLLIAAILSLLFALILSFQSIYQIYRDALLVSKGFYKR